MMPQQFNLKPQSKFDGFMEKYALPILIVVIGTVLSAIFLGKIVIVDFSWLMLGLGSLMILIAGYYIRYSIRTRRELQEQYEKDIADLRQEVTAAKNEYWKLVQDNTQLSEEWRENFRRYYAQDKKDFFDNISKQYSDSISELDAKLSTLIQSNQDRWANWITNHAHEHKEQLELIRHELAELEKKLTAQEEAEGLPPSNQPTI